MRPTHSPLPRPLPTLSRPGTSRRAADEKRPSEAKPPKKRSLNEAAHKLGY
ncbi:MAG TPA: hypothetical protein VNV17_12255 [Solirubrobacteraceae bacterium]|jgi:hypothetical protein|nr:hypothetical protein [Solirubrobacteraceae bacterium]